MCRHVYLCIYGLVLWPKTVYTDLGTQVVIPSNLTTPLGIDIPETIITDPYNCRPNTKYS